MTLELLAQAGYVDELILIVPAGLAIAVLTLVGYRIKKRSGEARRIDQAHQPPPPRSHKKDGG